MFNRPLFKSFPILYFLSIGLVVSSCNDEVVPLTFEEASVETSEGATIAVNYPKANDASESGKRINQSVETYIAKQIYMGENLPKKLTIDEAVSQFNEEFTSFRDDFPEAPEQWEALIDGEVTYKTDDLVCVAITTYLDTGGAHGNTYIRFLNFDAQTGSQLSKKDLITDMNGFSEMVETYLSMEMKEVVNDDTDENYFFGEDFKLPESIGFTDEGLVILYNTYEIAAYAQGATEFVIPFEEVKDYLAFEF